MAGPMAGRWASIDLDRPGLVAFLAPAHGAIAAGGIERVRQPQLLTGALTPEPDRCCRSAKGPTGRSWPTTSWPDR